MAKPTERQWYYFLAAFFALLFGAQGVHRLTEPTLAAASDARRWAVVAQAVLGTAVGFWFLWKIRREGRVN